jgi:hypothetical protein
MSKTASGAGWDSGPLVWCNEGSELARESYAKPELSQQNSPITDTILGCSMAPSKTKKNIMKRAVIRKPSLNMLVLLYIITTGLFNTRTGKEG